MSRTEFRSMGTWVVVAGRDVSAAAGDFAAAEAVFSRFDPGSELTLLNDNPHREVQVSGKLASCLQSAAAMRVKTDGLVDPAVGNAVVGWGYDRSIELVRDRTRPAGRDDLGSWSIDGRLVIRRPGTRLDLGGIAKGWTADRIVDGGRAEVVSAGGDVRSSVPETTVTIADPWGAPAATVVLGVGGLATSSVTRRRWKAGGEAAHHIVDPRRMAPAVSPVLSATVTATTAVEAEAGAKAVLLHGHRGLAWAEQQDWIRAALVIWHDGSVYATTGWDMAA
jgi:thiamine biosynthesis lipoprotein